MQVLGGLVVEGEEVQSATVLAGYYFLAGDETLREQQKTDESAYDLEQILLDILEVRLPLYVAVASGIRLGCSGSRVLTGLVLVVLRFHVSLIVCCTNAALVELQLNCMSECHAHFQLFHCEVLPLQ